MSSLNSRPGWRQEASRGNQIAAGADGNLWFVDQGSTKAIGRITTSGAITEYSAGLNAGADPNSIALGADGNVWFGDNGTTKAVGRITPAGVITEYTAALSATLPGGTGIVGGPDGNIWLADRGSSEGLVRVAIGGPVNTAAPTIAGSATQGQTLTATTGTWTGTPAPTTTYQWQDCNSSGTSCTNIAGATGSTYTLTPSDVGQAIDVVQTATNTLGVAPAPSAPTAVVTGAPLNSGLPLVSGTAQQGQSLSVTSGSWSGYPAPSFSYQWEDCNSSGSSCSNITGAAASSYTLAGSDVGSTVRAVVTATNGSGAVAATSSQTAVVLIEAPFNTVAPSVSGTVQQGQTLTASSGTWTYSPTVLHLPVAGLQQRRGPAARTSRARPRDLYAGRERCCAHVGGGRDRDERRWQHGRSERRDRTVVLGRSATSRRA